MKFEKTEVWGFEHAIRGCRNPKELSRWLREKPTRECKCTLDSYIYSVHTYDEDCEEEVSEKLESEKIMESGENHLWR